MEWIRMATGMKSDPSVHAIAADCCKGDEAKVTGHLQFLFAEMPVHARDGDVSAVAPAVLEAWAVWRGKRGAFDAAFREHMCTADGVVRSWAKHNGDAIEKAGRERERVRQWRENKHRTENDPPENGARTRNTTRTERPVKRGDVTGRDVKEEERGRENAPPSSSAGLSAGFVDPSQRDAYVGARRSARNPETFDAMLGSLASGMGAPRGKPLTWHQIGTAILQITGQPTPPPLSAIVIGGYAVKILAEPMKPTLSLMPTDEPGTVRDQHGKIVWDSGAPIWDRPTAEQIAANGWSVAA